MGIKIRANMAKNTESRSGLNKFIFGDRKEQGSKPVNLSVLQRQMQNAPQSASPLSAQQRIDEYNRSQVPKEGFIRGVPEHQQLYAMESPDTVNASGQLRNTVMPLLQNYLNQMQYPDLQQSSAMRGNPDENMFQYLQPLINAFGPQAVDWFAEWLQSQGQGQNQQQSPKSAYNNPSQDVQANLAAVQQANQQAYEDRFPNRGDVYEHDMMDKDFRDSNKYDNEVLGKSGFFG